MASSKLLKEAIADAKAVRETALANAKIQLEEAFTPRLKSMLSQKLRAEAEDMADDKEEDSEKMEEDYTSSNIGAGNGGTTSGQNNKKPTEHNAGAEDELGAADVTSTSKKPEAEVEDFTFEKSISEANGEEEDLASGDVKFATEADEFGGEDHAEPDADNAGGESDYDADNQQSEDDLDLEAIIKELEQELHGEGDEDNIDGNEYDAMGHDQNDMETEAADEVDTVMHADKPDAVIAQNESDDKDDDDEEMNIEEIIKELEEEEKAEEEEKEKVEENKALKAELAEAISVIKTLKSTINEVNLLNAKLLFSNKLFRSYNLTNEQKSKVIDSLDRTTNVREVKLVYSTLAESMKFSSQSPKKVVKTMAEGTTRVQNSTKPSDSQIISEGTTYANRFKELAGILK
jgi:hypothetical protein